MSMCKSFARWWISSTVCSSRLTVSDVFGHHLVPLISHATSLLIGNCTEVNVQSIMSKGNDPRTNHCYKLLANLHLLILPPLVCLIFKTRASKASSYSVFCCRRKLSTANPNPFSLPGYHCVYNARQSTHYKHGLTFFSVLHANLRLHSTYQCGQQRSRDKAFPGCSRQRQTVNGEHER